MVKTISKAVKKPQSKKNKKQFGNVISKRDLATILEGTFDKEKCVWKVEHVSQEEFDNKNSRPHNEIKFSTEFGNKHPQHFMQLLHFYFDECSQIQVSNDIHNLPKTWNKAYTEEVTNKIKANICVHKAYTKMDVVLNEIAEKLTLKQIYSMILQTNYALELLRKNKYMHGDFHFGNVGAIKTTQVTKKLGDITVPTLGFDWKLIDFGEMINQKRASKEEKERYSKGEKSNETFIASFATVIHSPRDDLSWLDLIPLLKKTAEYDTMKHISTNNEIISNLFMTLFPEKYLLLLKGTGKILRKNTIPVADLIFFAYHGANSIATREYLLDKIHAPSA